MRCWPRIPIPSLRRISPVERAGRTDTAILIARRPRGITSTWKSIIRIWPRRVSIFRPLHGGQAASAGPAQDCIVNKITEFEAELRDPATSPAERFMALKFLIHFIGDLHQPLHAADHEDRGGNCIGLAPSPDGHDTNLHAYWDVGAVEALGNSASAIAAELDARITPGELRAWSQGGPKAWAMESFELGRKDVYSLASRPECNDHGTVALTTEYEAAASKDAALQLEKAGVRMASVLNRALVP
jgi:hypothetical protein